MNKIKSLSYTKIEGSLEEKVKAYSTILGWNCTADYHNSDFDFFARQAENRGLSEEEWLAACRYADTERSKAGVEKLLNAILAKDKGFLVDVLHTGNKNYRRIFEIEAGISLGKTNKSMASAIGGW